MLYRVSIKQIVDFASLAKTIVEPITVSNAGLSCDGKNLLELFSLDYRYPIDVQTESADFYHMLNDIGIRREDLCM